MMLNQNLKEELGEILFGEGDGCSAVFEDEEKLFLFRLLDEEKAGNHMLDSLDEAK